MSLRAQALTQLADQQTAEREAARQRQAAHEAQLLAAARTFFALPVTILEVRELVEYGLAFAAYRGADVTPVVQREREIVLRVDDLEVIYSHRLYNQYGRNNSAGPGYYPVLACSRCAQHYPGEHIAEPRGEYVTRHQRQGQQVDRNGHVVLDKDERAQVLIVNIAASLADSPKLCPACFQNDKASTCPTCHRAW